MSAAPCGSCIGTGRQPGYLHQCSTCDGTGREPARAQGSWDEVKVLRREAEDYARKDDMLAAAMLDQRASAMADRLGGESVKDDDDDGPVGELYLPKEGRAITKALRSMVEAAKERGCTNPKLYFEPESHAIFVMDGDHPGYVKAGSLRCGAGERQKAIVGRAVLGDVGASFDAGGW